MSTEQKVAIDLEEINIKKRRLEVIKQELKSEFIGIDYIIDELINYIQIWYLMPDVLVRPIVVNLWGMTGVGKTDLIRRLVSKLEYQDRFVEVELSHGENYWYTSVASIFESNCINDGKPAIVLFDEIQRFYTIDPEGKVVTNTRSQDFWELLSDGRLSKKDNKESIDEYMQRYMHSSTQRQKRKNKPVDDDVADDDDDLVGLWEAYNLKKTFVLNESVHEIAEMKEDDMLKIMQQKRDKKIVFEPINHAKTLIIISGNLDEAYSMADEAGETDVDADIFRAFTEKITIIDIKKALSRKFKPEQVARFGNIHLIYRSLKKQDFNALIDLEVRKIQERNIEHFGLKTTVTDAVKQLVYQNGVFPVQGVRPVFSSIVDVVEANLSSVIFEALVESAEEITLDYNFEGKELIATWGETSEKRIPYIGKVDLIRQNNLPDMIANISVHESGHAVAYSLLLGVAPLQLKSRVASSYAGGFSFPHQIHMSEQNVLKKIKIYLAGGLAESLIFGEENLTIAQSFDREDAAGLVMEYIRKFGFDRNFSSYYMSSAEYSMDMTVTDWSIEKMMKNLEQETQELLAQNKDYLVALSKVLFQKGSLQPQEVVEIAQKYGHTLNIHNENHLIIAPYQDTLHQQS